LLYVALALVWLHQIALCSFGIGLVASIVKMNAMAFISSIGVSLAALYGPAIITGLFSGII
jgi:hypothetical protein